MVNLNDLADDTLKRIFCFLNFREIKQLFMTCSRFRNVLKKQVCLHMFPDSKEDTVDWNIEFRFWSDTRYNWQNNVNRKSEILLWQDKSVQYASVPAYDRLFATVMLGNKCHVQIWDLCTNIKIAEHIQSMFKSENEVIIAYKHHAFRMWQDSKNQVSLSLFDLRSGSLMGIFDLYSSHQNQFKCNYHVDLNGLYFVAAYDDRVFIVDLERYKLSRVALPPVSNNGPLKVERVGFDWLDERVLYIQCTGKMVQKWIINSPRNIEKQVRPILPNDDIRFGLYSFRHLTRTSGIQVNMDECPEDTYPVINLVDYTVNGSLHVPSKTKKQRTFLANSHCVIKDDARSLNLYMYSITSPPRVCAKWKSKFNSNEDFKITERFILYTCDAKVQVTDFSAQ